MPKVQEIIPKHLAHSAEAARAWFSDQQGSEFKLTGIVDADESPSPDLQLILCGTQAGQEVCLRERFSVRETNGQLEVAHVEDPPPEFGSVAPLLDPPSGARSDWLADAIGRHAFVVILFYRGFW